MDKLSSGYVSVIFSDTSAWWLLCFPKPHPLISQELLLRISFGACRTGQEQEQWGEQAIALPHVSGVDCAVRAARAFSQGPVSSYVPKQVLTLATKYPKALSSSGRICSTLDCQRPTKMSGSLKLEKLL